MSPAPTLRSWVAPPVDTASPNAFFIKVDSTWASMAAVLSKPNVGGQWVTESNSQSLAVGPKMTFFGLGSGCPNGASGPTEAPSAATLSAALLATGVNASNVSATMRWAPASTALTPACGTPGLSGESVGFVEDVVGGAFWVRTVSGSTTATSQPFFGPFDARGQSGSGANQFIQGSFSSFRQPYWLSTAPRPFIGTNRMRLRTVQSAPTFTVGPAASGTTQAKQQFTVTLLNVGCLNETPAPGPCQIQYLLTTGIKQSNVTDWSTVSWFQDATLLFDPAQGSLPVFILPLKALNAVGVESSSQLPLYRSQAEATQFSPFSKKVFDVAIEWPQFVNALKVVVAKGKGVPSSSVGQNDLSQFWGAQWADVGQWVLLQVEFGQETYNPLVATTRVEVAGGWHELYVGPQTQALQPAPLTQGFACNGTTDLLYVCAVEQAAQPALIAAGWVAVGNNCFHHAGSNACSASQYSACSRQGTFCRQDHVVEFLCDCGAEQPAGFANPRTQFFEHETGVTCL